VVSRCFGIVTRPAQGRPGRHPPSGTASGPAYFPPFFRASPFFQGLPFNVELSAFVESSEALPAENHFSPNFYLALFLRGLRRCLLAGDQGHADFLDNSLPLQPYPIFGPLRRFASLPPDLLEGCKASPPGFGSVPPSCSTQRPNTADGLCNLTPVPAAWLSPWSRYAGRGTPE